MKDTTFWQTHDWQSRVNLCKKAGIDNPTDDTLWRVYDGYNIIARNGVRLVKSYSDGTRTFDVKSQSDTEKCYRVHFNGSPAIYCNCPDWHKHDLKEAAKGIPFSTWICKHGIAAKLGWVLNQYRLDGFGTTPFHFTQRELKHHLDRRYGASNWKIVPFKDKYGFNSKKRGRVYAKNGYGKWRKTIENVRKCADDNYYLGSR